MHRITKKGSRLIAECDVYLCMVRCEIMRICEFKELVKYGDCSPFPGPKNRQPYLYMGGKEKVYGRVKKDIDIIPANNYKGGKGKGNKAGQEKPKTGGNTMNAQEIIKNQLEEINKVAKANRKRVKTLSNEFEYSSYYSGYAKIADFCETFEDYLELSAKLPINNELDSYSLYWRNQQNDSVCITHKIAGKTYHDTLYYKFIVGQPLRTLNLLTEGKCKIITEERKETSCIVTSLSCNL